MRTPLKGLFLLSGFLAIVAAIPLAYLLTVPRLPTGYEEVARQRQEDIKALTAAPEQTPVTAAAAKKSPSRLSAQPSPSRVAPPSRPNSPRQRFERWLALYNAALRNNQFPYGIERNKQVYSLSGLMYWPFGETSLPLGPGQWTSISKLTSNTLAYEQALRQIVMKNGILKNYRSDSNRLRNYSISFSTEERKAMIVEFAQRQPLPGAVELLSLPDGAIPEFPVHPLKNGPYHDFFTVLTQAWLHALANHETLDAAGALRRIQELRRYLSAALFPDYPYFNGQPLETFIGLTLASNLADGPTLAALARELARIQDEERNLLPARKQRLLRYQAQVTRDLLLDQAEAYYSGSKSSNNTFHFFMGGKPERIWLNLNHGNVTRHIDLLAVAIAGGNWEEVDRASASLQRVLKLANSPIERIPAGGPIDSAYPPVNDSLVARLAVAAYVKDHGTLPPRLADLRPAYLPEGCLSNGKNSMWWIDTTGDPPLLVHLTVESTAQGMLALIRDEAKFKSALAQEEKRRGRKFTVNELEQIHRTMNNYAKEHKDAWAILRVSPVPLDVTPVSPEGARKEKVFTPG